MCYAQCYHGDGSGVRHVHINYHGHLLYHQAAIDYCHGDGSDGRHVCLKHTHYYQATMLINCLRLFAVVILMLPW